MSCHRSQRFAFVACSDFGTPNCGNVTARQKRSLRFLRSGNSAEANSITARTLTFFFLYSEEGQLTPHISYHQFFNRLGNKILETFSTPHPAGSLFRVDLRLRPEGSAGPLARSLESMENYYAGFGETWERIALIKARGIAGSRELAYDFLRLHQPFIYPKSATPDLLEEIANIKHRIERDVVGPEKLERDVKLGRGGIRDIEFIVQTLQLIHGARNPFLQEPSMLKALRALRELDLLPRDEVLALDNAYRFLRRVEHRLQIEAEQQTHTVPDEPDPLSRLARSLRFSSATDFTAALHNRMGSVRPIFQRIISESPAQSAKVTVEFFKDSKRAEKALKRTRTRCGEVFMSRRELARYSKGCARFCWIGSAKLPTPMRL